MVRLIIFFLSVFQMAALTAHAEDMVTDIKEEAIFVDLRYDGEEIFVFGAIDPNLHERGELGLRIRILGEVAEAELLQQEQKWGLWQAEPVLEAFEIPSFAIFAQTPNFTNHAKQNAEQTLLQSMNPALDENMQANILRLAHAQKRYSEDNANIMIKNSQLFEARMILPSMIHEGDYQLLVELWQNDEMISSEEMKISVQKTGLGNFLAELSQNWSGVYGFLSLSIAMALGLAASVLFRKIFNDFM